MAVWWGSSSAKARTSSRRRQTAIRSICRWLIVALLAAQATAEAEPPRAPIEVLKASLADSPTLAYTARAACWHHDASGTKRELIRDVWKAADGRERTITMQGKQVVLATLMDGDTRYVWKSDSDYWEAYPAAQQRQHARNNVDRIAENYLLSRGDTHYLQRPAIIVRAAPAFPGRPELRVIVDAQTMLTLDLEVSRPGGAGAFGYSIERLDFGPIDMSLFDPPAEALVHNAPHGGATAVQRFDTPGGARGVAPFNVLVPSVLPDGFVLQDCILAGEPDDGKSNVSAGLHVAYGDGLSMISVYQRPGDQESSVRGFTEVRRGDRSVMWQQSRRNLILTTSVGGTRATVLGDVPLQELLDMTFSLAPAQ